MTDIKAESAQVVKLNCECQDLQAMKFSISKTLPHTFTNMYAERRSATIMPKATDNDDT